MTETQDPNHDRHPPRPPRRGGSRQFQVAVGCGAFVGVLVASGLVGGSRPEDASLIEWALRQGGVGFVGAMIGAAIAATIAVRFFPPGPD